MTVRELWQIFEDFKVHDFIHLRNKVDRIFVLIITALIGIVGTLIAIILK